jgi:purine nucleosidase
MCDDRPMSCGRVPIVVDTDGGVDDAVALWWLLECESVDVVAITVVHGNVELATAVGNVARVLEALGRADVPIAVGAATPYGPVPALRPADFIHGVDGLGETFRPQAVVEPVAEPAAALIVRHANERGGDLTIVTLGPLTNIAVALDADTTLPERVAAITVMGGTVVGPGNALPCGEANIAHDPAAARRVVAAGWADATLVGLDVTHRATLTSDEFALVDEHRNEAARFLAEPLRFYRRFGGTFCEPGEWPCHDLVAAMAAVDADIVSGPVLPLAVHADPGPAWGTTIADRRQPFFQRAGGDSEQALPDGFAPWRVALDVDASRFRREVRRMFGG